MPPPPRALMNNDQVNGQDNGQGNNQDNDNNFAVDLESLSLIQDNDGSLSSNSISWNFHKIYNCYSLHSSWLKSKARVIFYPKKA